MHGRILFYLGDVRKLFDQPIDELESLVDVGILAASEDYRADYLVAILQKLAGMVFLGYEVMLTNLRAQANFLVLPVMHVPFVLTLLLLVLEFAEIHDSADRGLFHRGDFHEIQSRLAGFVQSFVAFQ